MSTPTKHPSDLGFEVEIKTSGRAHDGDSPRAQTPVVLSPARAAARASARRRNLKLLMAGAVGLVAIALWAYLSNPNSIVPSDAVARVNGEYVYDRDITHEIDLERAILDITKNTKDKPPSAADALENLLNFRVQVQDAKKAGTTVTPEEAASALKDTLSKMGATESTMSTALGKYNLTLDDLKQVSSDGVLVNKHLANDVLAGANTVADRQQRANDWQTSLSQSSKIDRFKSPGSGPAPTLGSEAPDFTLRAMSGEEIKLSALRGHPVMINFWATWCSPCRVEIPEIARMYSDTHKGGNYEILGVATNSEQETIKAFSKELGMTFPLLPDDGNHITSLYHVLPIPTTFFIDKDGIIRDTHIGPVDRALMEKWLLGE